MIAGSLNGPDVMNLAQKLFRPRSVALIGASGDGAKNAGRPQRFLVQHGYRGDIFPVNPSRKEVQGIAAYARVKDVPSTIDHALIMIPAIQVPDVLLECAAVGVSVATIYSDGFAETGAQGQELQQRCVEIATAHNMRILGPNSMGIINTQNGMALSVNAVLEMPELIKGRIGVVSQSGTILGTLLSRGAARGIGFSQLVSVGNESDLSVGEIVKLQVDDNQTDAIILFLEGIRNPGELAAAARYANAKQKPVLVYKLGKSEAGRELAVSHSGALASSSRITSAYFKAHGMIEVDMLESLFEMPPLVIGRRPRPGNCVSVVTTTGGGAAMVADRLGMQGLELVGPSDRLRRRLFDLGVEIGAGPLIDLTMAGTRKGVYGAALDELLSDDRTQAVVCVVGSSGQFHPELAVAPILDAAKSHKFVAAFIAPEADKSLKRLNDAGIAAFRTPEACADAVVAALSWQPIESGSLAQNLNLPSRSSYNEFDALELFKHLGVPVVPSQRIRAIEELGPNMVFPVVAKILSDEIAHKSDVGGVRTGIPDLVTLKHELSQIRAAVQVNCPNVDLSNFLIQTMENGLAEVLLGYRRDPEVGPIVILGSGGLMAEVMDDVAIALAPLDYDQAVDLIAKVKGLVPLMGYRRQPKGDIEALALAIVSLSQLAAPGASHIVEAEINPLLVKGEGEGVVALDGLVRSGT